MWQNIFVGENPDEVGEFWMRIERWSPEWWRVHPLRTHILADPEKWSPLTLFIDDCAVNKERDRNMTLGCISSILNCMETFSNQLLNFVMRKEWIIEGATDFTMYEVWKWSINALAAGIWPETDHRGEKFKGGNRKTNAKQPLVPGGHRAVVILYPASFVTNYDLSCFATKSKICFVPLET